MALPKAPTLGDKLITFEHLLEFGTTTDSNKRVELGALALLKATGFDAVAITYSTAHGTAHVLEYGYGYRPEVYDFTCQTFVVSDPYYASVVAASKPTTWDNTDFPSSYAAERWLRPMGFRNGLSAPIVHKDVGEVGSIHMNSHQQQVSDRQLETVEQFIDFLADKMANRKKRQQLGLTQRETQIVHLIAQGASNPDIAEELYISSSTVRTHLENILRKFDTHTRVGVAVKAAKMGLL